MQLSQLVRAQKCIVDYVVEEFTLLWRNIVQQYMLFAKAIITQKD